METVDLSRFFFSLAAVITLIWLCALLAKRSGFDKKMRGVTAGSRLAVEEALFIDPKRKLLLVRADTKQYVLLLAGENVTVIDTLDAPKPKTAARKKA